MSLSASGLANAITAEQGTAEDAAKQTDANLKLATAIVNYLIANGVINSTIPPSAINTAGGPAAQVGPPSPVSITGTIS